MSSTTLDDKKEKKVDFTNYKEFVMYFHTSIRNVGLFTAVSFAALANSKFYKDKNKTYTAAMIIIALLLLANSSIINYLLYDDVEKYVKIDGYKELEKLVYINYLFMIIHVLTISFGIYAFYKLFLAK
jgi:hypothetical protein